MIDLEGTNHFFNSNSSLVTYDIISRQAIQSAFGSLDVIGKGIVKLSLETDVNVETYIESSFSIANFKLDYSEIVIIYCSHMIGPPRMVPECETSQNEQNRESNKRSKSRMAYAILHLTIKRQKSRKYGGNGIIFLHYFFACGNCRPFPEASA